MTAPLRNLVVATDLSERSDRAVARAMAIARENEARVTVVSVVDDSYPPALAERMIEDVRSHLGALGATDDLELHIQVEAGDATETLLGVLNAAEVDLAVVGLHRRRAILDGIRQTTMERLVLGARPPVLLVKSLPTRPYSRVLAPVSMSPACTAAIGAAQRAAPNAALELFHAWQIPFDGFAGGPGSPHGEQIKAEVTARAAAWHGLQPVGVPAPDLHHGMLDYTFAERLSAFGPDLVALGAHTRSGPALFRLGSFTAGIVRNPPSDLLIARG